MSVVFWGNVRPLFKTTKVNNGKLLARATNRRTGPQIQLNRPWGVIFFFFCVLLEITKQIKQFNNNY